MHYKSEQRVGEGGTGREEGGKRRGGEGRWDGRKAGEGRGGRKVGVLL